MAIRRLDRVYAAVLPVKMYGCVFRDLRYLLWFLLFHLAWVSRADRQMRPKYRLHILTVGDQDCY